MMIVKVWLRGSEIAFCNPYTMQDLLTATFPRGNGDLTWARWRAKVNAKLASMGLHAVADDSGRWLLSK